jgi:hypothetical protein
MTELTESLTARDARHRTASDRLHRVVCGGHDSQVHPEVDARYLEWFQGVRQPIVVERRMLKRG